MRSAFAALASVALLACQTPNPEGAKKDAPAQAPATDAKTAPDAKTVPSLDTKTAGDPTNPAAVGDAKANEPAAATTAPADPTAPPTTAGTPPADSAGTPPTDAAAPAGDKAKLIDEAKAKKTSDARAKKALEEAEKAGATPRELAEAANARGEALFGEPDRATPFFEWSRDKDPTYPEPVFNLAKQSANAGEIPKTVELLKEVHKRGGKKLLKQVGFDPTFEIVKDDPEVQKLLK